MKQKRLLFVLLSCAWILSTMDFTALPAFAMTGNEWRGWPETGRLGYVWGVVDTWSVLQKLEARQQLEERSEQSSIVAMHTDLALCIQKMSYVQMSAIVEKYMQNNPAEWHYLMASLVWSAIHETCSGQTSESSEPSTKQGAASGSVKPKPIPMPKVKSK